MPCAHKRPRSAPVALQNLPRRTQERIDVEEAGGQALEQVRFIAADAEMVQLHLGTGPGLGPGPLEDGLVTVAIGHGQELVPAAGDKGYEADARAGTRGQANAPSQAEDWIENRAETI